MVGGTCDPASRIDPATGAPYLFNVIEISMGNGAVTVTARYDWDHVSVRPDCNGPLVDGTGPASNRWAIQVVNNDTVDWLYNTVGRRNQPRTLALPAGQTRRFTAVQAAAAGYADRSDLDGLTLTRSG